MGRLQSRPKSPKEKDSTVLKRILILEEEMEAHPQTLSLLDQNLFHFLQTQIKEICSQHFFMCFAEFSFAFYGGQVKHFFPAT
jgi:hypothetical protein